MTNPDNSPYRKITTHVLQEMKLRSQKIAMLTAYDYSMAGLLDNAGIDVILVGDSASNVMAGFKKRYEAGLVTKERYKELIGSIT